MDDGVLVHPLARLRQFQLGRSPPVLRVWEHPRWHVAISNLGIYASLYVVLCMAIGLGLAILLDQRIRAEGGLRALFLYPMALSFIVTGTAWKWILNPGLGLTKLFHDWGWTSFQFDWIINDDMAIYTVVIAAVWQASGFVMAMFLAGLRGIDQEQIKAASIDGARMPADLSPNHHSAASSGLHIGVRDSRAPRGQKL